MDRREFIKATTATTLTLTILPSPAVAKTPEIDPQLIKNLEWFFGERENNIESHVAAIDLNLEVARRIPQYFTPGQVMSDVTCSFGLVKVTAKTRALQTLYNRFESDEALAEVMRAMETADQLAYELHRGWAKGEAGMTIHPYVPIAPIPCVDPMSYAPCLGFKTKYGVSNWDYV